MNGNGNWDWNRLIVLLMLSLTMVSLTTGCATTLEDPGPSALSTTQRAEMGRLAIRAPTAPPSIDLIGDETLETKGEASKSMAAGAAIGWLGGSLEAGAESGDPLGFLLMATIGIIGAPVAAVGGAVYGAAAADSEEELVTGNGIISSALSFAPQHFGSSLTEALDGTVALNYTLVDPEVPDAELRADGFDAVLNIKMENISGSPSENGLEVSFMSGNRVELVSLDDGRLVETRFYEAATPARNVSHWAAESAQSLFDGLGVGFDEMASQIVDVFFVAPSIRVQGLEPVSKSQYRIGRINTLQPLFVWGALDGERAVAVGDGVEYEIMVFEKDQAPETGMRTVAARYVPAQPLENCESYQWKVRAHYEQFGASTISEWSPVYRFKTPCSR